MKRFPLPAVDADVTDAFLWYETQRSGLGEEFLAVVRGTVGAVEQHPLRFPGVYQDVRRALTPRPFPYQVLYFIDEERGRVVILAVLHQARNPQIWQGRREGPIP
jgi:plasmid stabilization system protein ParE